MPKRKLESQIRVPDATRTQRRTSASQMASDASVRKGLSKFFDSAVTGDSAVMTECIQICSDYNISGEDLFFKWEAFSFNNVPITPTAGTSRTIQSLTLDGAKALRAHIAREVARSNEKRTISTRTNNLRVRGGVSAVSTRYPGRRGTQVPLVSTSSGRIQDDRAPMPTSVNFVGPTSADYSRRSYRYMFEKISARSEVLDDRIDEFNEIIREKYDVEELADPGSVTEDVVTVVGRICLDAEADAAFSSTSSKLSSSTLVLETSRMGGSGERIALKFDSDFTIRDSPNAHLGKSLFPGEIVALRGRNGGGGWFSVKEILPIPLLESTPTRPLKELSVLVASGPYTPENTLDFGAFNSIIEEAKDFRPSVLLLLGPFIDTSHPFVKSGKLSHSPLTIFQQAFLNPIQSYLQKNADSLVLLVPSIRDLLSSHNVFPQGVVDGDFGRLSSAVKVLPNPCLFSLNGIRFGVSTVDVLFHLKNQQYVQKSLLAANVSLGPASHDAMADICRHLLEQRSFYPLFPVPAELSADVNLDASHSEHLKFDSQPDVLILPSIFRQFSKIVEGVTMINPSIFAKSRIAAELHVPAGAGGAENEVRVDLKRLP